MMILALLTLFGAFFNRVRGGWFDTGASDAINIAAFTILSACFFWPMPWVGLGAGVGMYAGSAPGWGTYLGYMLDLTANRGKSLVGWAPIDLLIEWVKPWPRVWGTLGTAFRGAFWGFCLWGMTCLCLWAFVIPWIVLIGFLGMPAAYVVGHYFAKWANADNPDGAGWELGEVLFGAILWGSYFANFAN